MAEQIITSPSGERLVVLPEAEFLSMREAMEDRADIEAINAFERKRAAGEEELIPAEVVNRILDGENKVRVWREYRGLTARDLATKVSVSASYLSQIETGTREGTVNLMKRIAAALDLALDEIV